jgi:YVTN family beta-propeller protein
MRLLRQSRPGAPKRQPPTARPSAAVVGLGLLVTGLLGSASACGAPTTSPDHLIYVTNQVDNTLSVIDGSTYHVVATVPVGAFPAGGVVSSDRRHAYIAQGGDNTVAVFDTSTNTITKTVSVAPGNHLRGVALTPNGQLLYVANGGSNSVSVLGTRTDQIVASLPVGSQPVSVAVTPDGASAYVANSGSNNVSRYSASTTPPTPNSRTYKLRPATSGEKNSLRPPSEGLGSEPCRPRSSTCQGRWRSCCGRSRRARPRQHRPRRTR